MGKISMKAVCDMRVHTNPDLTLSVLMMTLNWQMQQSESAPEPLSSKLIWALQ